MNSIRIKIGTTTQTMRVGETWVLDSGEKIEIASFCQGLCACRGKCIVSTDGRYWNFQGNGPWKSIKKKNFSEGY